MNTLPITEADLHAFVDGKLPAARRLEVDAYLAQRPEEAERLRAYTAQTKNCARCSIPCSTKRCRSA